MGLDSASTRRRSRRLNFIVRRARTAGPKTQSRHGDGGRGVFSETHAGCLPASLLGGDAADAAADTAALWTWASAIVDVGADLKEKQNTQLICDFAGLLTSFDYVLHYNIESSEWNKRVVCLHFYQQVGADLFHMWPLLGSLLSRCQSARGRDLCHTNPLLSVRADQAPKQENYRWNISGW